MLDTIIQAVLAVITLVSAGGWFINYRQKKTIESANAQNAILSASDSAVELAEKIAQKYNALVLSTVNNNAAAHEKRHDDVEDKLDTIAAELQIIGEYLNGNFVKFKQERDANGRFVKK
ncbi:MAG: hypothetical protein LBN95_13740 [Prevotellaceae bacterium]|jgi:cbb3-type cytochrome oxidase subunit 3|nr:hypothetical protein [Prevotellaceae bacterium]